MDTVYLGHKECQRNIFWFDNEFWNDLPNPTDNQLPPQQNHFEIPRPTVLPHSTYKVSEKCKKHKSSIRNESLCDVKRKYFNIWKDYTHKSREIKNDLHMFEIQEQKLNTFLNTLNEHKLKLKEIQKCVNVKSKSKYSQNTSCYEHRFEAQQNIIEFQKLKLVQQEKIIEQLKLGKLNEEINRSIEETEKELKDAFLKCSSSKAKDTAVPILKSLSNPNVLSLYPITNKAPKIVQEMESRALEREQRRQIILQRKQILEQKRKEEMLIEIERKKTLEEQARKENLQSIKERRKKELEHQQMIKIRKQEFFEKCIKVDGFYKRKLKAKGLLAFSTIVVIKHNNILKSEAFYETYLKKRSFNRWINFINSIYDKKYGVADRFYSIKLLQRAFNVWFKEYDLSVQNLQVAEDLYGMRLQSNTFIHWHRYTCKQYALFNKNMQKAQKHFNSRILLQYFYQWRSLPSVLKIEKAKEEKKQRWREKVWEILPDYNPSIED